MNLDLFTFNFINSLAGRQKWLDFLAVFFAKYLSYLMAIFLIIYAVILNDLNIFFLPIFAGLFSRFIINEIIYYFYKRKRPLEVINSKTLIKIPRHPSFPSGHASFFFALSFVLLPYNVSLAITFIVLSFLISFSRVFSGVHWPSDILGGIAAGAISYFLFLWILFSL